MKDLRTYLFGIAAALTVASIGAMMVMWRDIAVLQEKTRHLEETARYYHGSFDVPKENR